jgi:hypothetical protein
MSLESGWKGRVGAMIPPGYWRRAIELMDNKTPASASSIADLRRLQAEAFEGSSRGSAHRVQWQGDLASVYVDSHEAPELCSELRAQGFSLAPMAEDALDPAAMFGWSCATKSQTGRRSDLVEAIGVRVLVVPGGKAPAMGSILKVSEPIDLVYTWVDGADEAWQPQTIRRATPPMTN